MRCAGSLTSWASTISLPNSDLEYGRVALTTDDPARLPEYVPCGKDRRDFSLSARAPSIAQLALCRTVPLP